MPRYSVFMVNQVSTVVEVDAESPEEAQQLVYDSDQMPGMITYGAFGDTEVDDSDWEVESISDEAGQRVWPISGPADQAKP